MEPNPQEDKILLQLVSLNEKIAKQISFKHIFYTGIIYGLGVVIGSAILATIALGILWPYISQIAWVGDSYQAGTTILHPVLMK
ncbi:MAG: hypothetical protein WC791_02140 [Candidatus Paceibacterota bacterium]|jgi:hypothetical protein